MTAITYEYVNTGRKQYETGNVYLVHIIRILKLTHGVVCMPGARPAVRVPCSVEQRRARILNSNIARCISRHVSTLHYGPMIPIIAATIKHVHILTHTYTARFTGTRYFIYTSTVTVLFRRLTTIICCFAVIFCTLDQSD